jgi:hypothetical protein
MYNKKPGECYNVVGANGPMYYFEGYYKGRPGYYLYYYVGGDQPLMYLTELKKDEEINTVRTYARYNCKYVKDETRKDYKIKFLLVSNVPIKNLPFLPGPNSDQMMLLN